jgi:hypothetical protein
MLSSVARLGRHSASVVRDGKRLGARAAKQHRRPAAQLLTFVMTVAPATFSPGETRTIPVGGVVA